MFTKTKSFALAALAATGLAVAAPLPAIADGAPVVSLGITPVGPMRLPFYNTNATPVTTARVIGYGPSPDFAPIYDTNVLQSVTRVRSAMSGSAARTSTSSTTMRRRPALRMRFPTSLGAKMTSPYALPWTWWSRPGRDDRRAPGLGGTASPRALVSFGE